MANWIDLTVLAVLCFFGLRGFFRGLFREVFSLAGLIAGFFVAVRYSETAALWGAQYWQVSSFFLKGAAFVALFFAVYFFFNLTGWLLHRSEKLLFLKTLNRIGGIAVGAGKGTALTALLVLFLTSSSWLPDGTRATFERAVLIAPLTQLGGGILRVGKERLFAGESSAVPAPGRAHRR